MDSYGAFIHDYIVERYTVDIEAHTLSMETRPEDPARQPRVSLKFHGLLAHHFEDVIGCNILLDLNEGSAEDFTARSHDFLMQHIPYGFPILNLPYVYPLKSEDLKQLPQILRRDGYHIFELSASLGLTGFVIAKGLNVVNQ